LAVVCEDIDLGVGVNSAVLVPLLHLGNVEELVQIRLLGCVCGILDVGVERSQSIGRDLFDLCYRETKFANLWLLQIRRLHDEA
jgi:hypothetical protein